jgi:predicted nuclease with TOPRIM domain
MKPEGKMGMPNIPQGVTLIMALENLKEKADRLKDLKRLSIKLKEKFDRTEGMVKDDEIRIDQLGDRVPNLIDLFMNLAEDMQASINAIGNNTERVLNMID